MRIAIVGSRTLVNQVPIHNMIRELLGRHHITSIISGGATGADTLGASAAHFFNIPLVLHLPEWDKYGKSAGFRRNELIVRDADMLLAFFADGPRSPGTNHSVHLARKKGIPVHVYHEGTWS